LIRIDRIRGVRFMFDNRSQGSMDWKLELP